MPASPLPAGEAPQLSVVVAAHDMQREIERTIRSLSPGMQRDMAAEDYEVIVVDNGSPEPLDTGPCEEYGAPLRWMRLDDAPPSPAKALNLGIGQARAPLVGAMIDGARLASPGLLHHARVAARLHPRAVTATLGFHLGPDYQPRSVAAGYDRQVEDQMLERISWAEDGYRLFDVSVFAGSSRNGWFAPPAESNALFMSAELWSELEGFDERFASPGGGLVNLDLFARACELPDARVVVLLGEGTFHQVHGGANTNEADAQSAWENAHDEYKRLRGEAARFPAIRPLYVGAPAPQAVESMRSPGERSAARRYIDLLKRSLLNETALEAEAAYFMARDSLESGEPFDDAVAFDLAGGAPEYLASVREARHSGRYFDGNLRNVGFSHTMVGRPRLDNLDECVTAALDDGVEGDMVECGVWRGGAAILMRGILAVRDVDDRTVWLADSFAGLPKPDHPQDTLDLSREQRPELAVSRERVASNFERYGLLDDRVRFLPGWFKDTLPDAPIASIAVLRLDGDLYESTMTSLEALYERVSPGGFVIIDDYGAIPACKQATDEFRAARGIDEELVDIDWTGVYWRRRR